MTFTTLQAARAAALAKTAAGEWEIPAMFGALVIVRHAAREEYAVAHAAHPDAPVTIFADGYHQPAVIVETVIQDEADARAYGIM